MTRNILIVGRGTAGQALAQDIRRRGEGEVVGFLDDSSSERDVLGSLGDVDSVIEGHSVDLVYFAIPSIDAATVRGFVASISHPAVEIAIIPRTYAILSKNTVDIDDLTDIDVLDLVGRQPVKHDAVESRRFIEGKRVLITGAAGSIGSRLVEQVAAMGAARVVCVDWWENGMFDLGNTLGHRGDVELEIADIKNGQRMRRVLERHRPDIVFHAAAYKHVPLMQANPVEAIDNNVGGTLNLMDRAIEAGVSNFIMVSTDKAVNPANVMGATKRLGELAMRSLAAQEPGTRFNAVRFGNVIQSNGSVMQTFRRQILSRSPLTVTHEDVTRFFMTLDEACQLVIQSGFAGDTGDLFVLDMGEPVRILDLARSLIAAVDPSLTIDIVGLRPGEKMFEELAYDPGAVHETANPKILVVREEGLGDGSPSLAEIRALVARTGSSELDDEGAMEILRTMGFEVADEAGASPKLHGEPAHR